MAEMVNAQKRSAGFTRRLQDFLGQEIIVPAKTVGLSDLEQFLPGKVVDYNMEDNSLWCTVSGDKRWYLWHMEDVKSWLLAPGQGSVRASSMAVSPEKKPASRGLPQSPPGKSQRPQLAGSKPRPPAPGPEQLWKYCKRCNSWKKRPADFSKNHRTPDGLQFYCRFCHNRMTKFNQQRRLEDLHIAEKHHVISSPRRGHPVKIAAARTSHASSTSRSPSSPSKGSPGFDVINSKIPRQQRTHTIYRKDSDPSMSSHPSPRQQSLKSPSPSRDSSAFQPPKAQRSLGSDNGICNQRSHSSVKQQVQQLSKPKPRHSPDAQSQARASAELMLQANAVLEELDQSLLLAAEAAAAEVAASAARPFSDSRALPKPPATLPSPQPTSPRSPLVPRVVSSASPRVHIQSQQLERSREEPGSSPLAGHNPSPQSLRHRCASMPTQQHTDTSSSLYTLSHSLAQLRQACTVDPDPADNRDEQHQQGQGQEAQQLTIKSPAAHKAETRAGQASLGAEHALPDTACEPAHDAQEHGQSSCHNGRSNGLASPERSESGISHVSQGRSVQGPSGDQHLPSLHTMPVGKSGSKAAEALADTDSRADVSNTPGSLCKEGLPGAALLSGLHPSDGTAKAALHLASLAKAVNEVPGRSIARAMSSPPGPTQGAIPDVSPDPGPLAAPTPLEHDPSTNPESAEPPLTKRKIPRLAASSDLANAVMTGSPTVSVDAADSTGRRSSSGVQLASHKGNASTKVEQPPDSASAIAPPQQDTKPTTVPGMFASGPSSSLPIGSLTMPFGGSLLPTTAAPGPPEGLGSVINALSLCTSPQKVQGFLADLQARGNCQQVLAELEQHFRHAGLYLSSVGTAQAPLLLGRRPLMATAVAARPQLQPGPATVRAPSTSNAPKLPHFATASSLPLPKKASKKRTRAESSNASLEAAINSLRSDISPAPSTFSDSPMFPPPPFTASMPVAAFGTSAARLALLAGGVGGVGGGGAPRPGPVFGNPTSFAPGTSAARSSGASAAGPPGNAALELSLLLTTLQSLAHLPEEQGQPINIIASSSQAAEAQLRDWLRQLQQHASDASGDLSAAQHSQEDAAIAAQVRREMWGNLQSILAMLAGEGCSPHVQEMVHQIAVHFVNEQSQSVALGKRMTCDLSREKEAQKRLQQQLRGSIQVLSSLQKVLGAVRMQQQRAKSAVEHFAAELGSETHSINQRVEQAETAEATAQQAVRALQKKEAAWEAELGAAQTSNAQLHMQVAALLQDKAALQKQNSQHAEKVRSLASLQAEKDTLAQQLSEVKKNEAWLKQRQAADLDCHEASEENRLTQQVEDTQPSQLPICLE